MYKTDLSLINRQMLIYKKKNKKNKPNLVRVDLGVIIMEYSTFPKAPKLKPRHQ